MKKITWLGDSLDELKTFPDEVMGAVGYALYQVQSGLVPRSAKPLTGFKPAVIEIVSDHDKNTYRSVY